MEIDKVVFINNELIAGDKLGKKKRLTDYGIKVSQIEDVFIRYHNKNTLDKDLIIADIRETKRVYKKSTGGARRVSILTKIKRFFSRG